MDHECVDWPVALPTGDAIGVARFSIGAAPAFGVQGASPQNIIVAPLDALFEVRVGASRFLVDANQLLLAPADEPLQLTVASGPSNARCAHVALDNSQPTHDWPDHIALKRRDSATALHLYLTIAALTRGSNVAHHARQFVRMAMAAPLMPASQPQLINRALIALHRNGPAKQSLVRFADTLYRESKHLTREFKRARGEPFYRYQMRLRLHHALGALTQGVAITEVALACGFSSHAHFSACFRSCFGVSPSELRKLACGGAPRALETPSAVVAQAF